MSEHSKDKLQAFFNLHRDKAPAKVIFPKYNEEIEKCDFIMHKSGLPYWEVPFEEMPYEDMYKEAYKLKHLFRSHRANDPKQKGDAHKDWSSLTIHGISAQHTMNWDSYPQYKELLHEELVPYKWTEIESQIPATVKFLKEQFPHGSYTRVRYMLLPPGGFILPHRDRDHKLLFPVNIALNNPKGCEFVMENNGVVPFEPGKAFLLDLSNEHAIWNNSNEDRIHMIIHWRNGEWHEESGKRWINKVSQNYIPTNLQGLI